MTSPNIDYPVRLEAAFGADPADPDSWTWTDLSDDLIDQTVVIKRGRADEASSPAATSAKFIVDNQTGDYTPTRRDSIHYPHIRRGVPLRFSVWYGEAWEVRFVGFAESWAPSWPHGDLSDGDYLGESFVTIDAAGPLRRLAQNTAVRVDDPAGNVVARWADSDYLYSDSESDISGVLPLTRSGPGTYASPYVLTGTVPSHADPTSFTVWNAYLGVLFGDFTPWSAMTMLDVRTTGHIWRWLVRMTDTTISVYSQTSAGALTLRDTGTNFGPYDGTRRMAFSVTQTSANQVDWTLIHTAADQPNDGSHYEELTGSVANVPAPLGRVTGINCNTIPGADYLNINELAVTTGEFDWDPDDLSTLLWEGERAGRRIERVAGLYNIPFTGVGDLDDSTILAAHAVTGPAEIIAEAAKADLGTLAEDVDTSGITYRTKGYNQDVDLALSTSDLLDPFVPVLDDQRYHNVVSVTPTGGTKASATDETMVAADGRRENALTLNILTDAANHAAWRLRLAALDAMRYPTITAEMSADWLGIRCGDRVTVTDLPPQHPVDDVDVIVEGWTETITNTRWTIQASCSPAFQWDVGVLDADRCDTAGSTLESLVAQVARITTAAHYLEAPDAAPLDITGDIDVRWDGALTDWTAAADQVLAAKWNSFGVINQRSWRLYVSTTGVPTLTWSTDGTATVTATSTAALSTSNGDRVRIRATLDVDDGAGNRVIRFYTSTSFDTPLETETDWTQLGSTVTTAGTTSIHSGSGNLTVGALVSNIAGLFGAVGDHYAAAVLSGIAGTVVANPDFTDPAQTTVGATTATDTHGNVFTLTGADVDIVAHNEATVTTTTGPDWDATAVPFDIEVDVETMTVTAITGTAPQTFTLTRPDPQDHDAGAAVALAAPLVAAL